MEDDEIEKRNKERESYIALMEATRECKKQYIHDVDEIEKSANGLDTDSPIMANYQDYVRNLFASQDYAATFDGYINWIDNNID